MIVIGGVIGAGIFRTPATIAERTGNGWQVLVLWTIGGLLTLAGALCYAELGARRPQAGGTYVYLREAFGKLPAFLFGWTMALINYPGSVAAVATTFADYLCAALGFPTLLVKPVAVGAIAFIVGVNLFGIRAGAWLQNVFALLKLAAIAVLLMAGLVLAYRRKVWPGRRRRRVRCRRVRGSVHCCRCFSPMAAFTISTILPVRCGRPSGRCRGRWGWD